MERLVGVLPVEGPERERECRCPGRGRSVVRMGCSPHNTGRTSVAGARHDSQTRGRNNTGKTSVAGARHDGLTGGEAADEHSRRSSGGDDWRRGSLARRNTSGRRTSGGERSR